MRAHDEQRVGGANRVAVIRKLEHFADRHANRTERQSWDTGIPSDAALHATTRPCRLPACLRPHAAMRDPLAHSHHEQLPWRRPARDAVSDLLHHQLRSLCPSIEREWRRRPNVSGIAARRS